MDIAALKKILQDNGVAGAGGAGFPSYAKLNERAECIILNCAECEPLLRLHRQVLERFAPEITKALHIIRETLGAKEFILGVKRAYKGAIQAVQTALSSYPDGRIKLLDEVYPAGDEVSLIHAITGHVVPAAGLPIAVGAIVFNVETMLNAYRAIEETRPVTHKYVTVAGEVHHPKTVYAPIGTSFSDLIALAGGKTMADTAIIHGGPMTGRLSDETAVVTKTTNAVLVLPKNHYIIGKRTQKITISAKRAMSVCCQCHTCTDLCPRHLLGHPIDPAAFMRSVSSTVADTKALLDSQYCCQCGLCAMYSCPQGLAPAALIGVYKANLRKNNVKPETLAQNDEAVLPEQPLRRVPMARLVARLGLTAYEHPAPISDEAVIPKTLCLSLSQHIGQSAVPVVQRGDLVQPGTLLAKAADGALSLPVHAPLSALVTDVTKTYITLRVN